MISDINQHPIHYSLLALLLGGGILAFALLRYDPILQMMIVLAITIGYVIWGVVHHYLIKDLKAEIVLEYLIIAALVLSMFWAFLL